MVGAQWRKAGISLPLVANHLYGPSCVSLDYALAWHGLIPERVMTVTSLCIRRARSLENALGRFTYATLPASIYPVGIQMAAMDGKHFLIAGPEKALCDKVILTRNLHATGKQSMQDFLFADLRIDADMLVNLDLSLVDQYVALNIKSKQFKALRLILESLQ